MQNQNSNNYQQIEEDVLIVGGGPVGGFIAYVFAQKYNFTVRILERLPDLSDPKVEYQDRSGNFSLSYRAAQVFEKYGLKYEFFNIANICDYSTFVVDDTETKRDFMPGQKLMLFPTARRDVAALFNKLNRKSSNIVYEYQTQVENIDYENNIITTFNQQTNQVQTRKFKFLIGADGYRSMVRQTIDRQLVKDRKLPKDTVLTKIEENLISTMNINLPNLSGYLQMQEQVKQGKYPWYDKLDNKYKNGYLKLCGKYIWDPSTLGEYGYQNLCGFVGPMSDGRMNIYIGILRNKDSIKNFLENHPEYKGSWRLNPNYNTNAEDIQTDEQIHNFFAKHFPIFYGMCPDVIEQWKNTRAFSNYTVYCDNWYYQNKACMFGDACEGISFICGNGYNLALHNMDNFFKIIEQNTKGDVRKFLQNQDLRQQVFSQYQAACFDYTRAEQISDVSDCLFPSLVQAQHPKDALFQQVESVLFEKCDRIYNNKINLQFSTIEEWHCVSKKADLFKNYILEKVEHADKIEDIDLSNCRQDLITLLEQNNLPIYYTFETSMNRYLRPRL